MDEHKVIFREAFLRGLGEIVKSIAVHNPHAARKLGLVIIQTAESLSFFPERYPRVRQRPGVRRFVAGKHFKVFYRIKPESRTVEILRCWDGRRWTNPAVG